MATSYRFLTRGGTAANLAAVNEVLLVRELCYERDTGKGKLGDGVTPWNSLPYLPGANNVGAYGAIGATFDGGGAVLIPGAYVDVLVPYAGTITAATVMADQTGSLVLSVLADPYADFPPTTDIAPTTPPTISATDKSRDVTLSGWTTAVAAGTVVRFGIVSCASIQHATLTLEITKT